jgi:choline dehydrogenase-like flavoprotein
VDAAKNQRFVFQLFEQSAKTFEQLWFQLTPEKAATETYDIIVIGTGMGAGVIAGDLFDTNSKLGDRAKSVLVIEKGGLVFHSHCLNAARPSGFGEDRGQQNNTFYALFRENYQFKDPKQSKEWEGGPMFNLGGRGAAWGLFIPRIHDENLRKKFGTELCDQLVNTWYKEAEGLMGFCLPMTNTFHQNLMERLNIETGLGCQWQWGRIASEFSQSKNFDFALGAFSPIDKLLEIAMSKRRNDDGTCVEHPNWKILLKSEVRSIMWDSNDGKRAAGVVVRDASGNETNIFLKKDSSGKPLVDTKIVLGAGSVGSPAILMRSGMTKHLKELKSNALHLTDHNLCGKAVTFHYLDPTTREKVGSMKLQSYVRLKSGKIALVNMAIDSSSFLPREFLPSQFFRNEDFPKLTVASIIPTELIDKNTMDLDYKGEPVLSAGREVPFSNDDEDVAELRELTKKAISAVKEVLHIEIRLNDSSDWDDDNFFPTLPFGAAGHELGTIPLKCHDNGKKYHLEDDLRLRTREGVYVCDNSIFPFSPEVNPTLTLVALALRLSKTILSPTPTTPPDVDTVYIMNQTGEPMKVFISNRGFVNLTDEEIDDNKECKVLGPGEVVERKRRRGVDESVMVYRLDYNTDTVYLPTPVPYIATPGRICAIE